MIVTLIIPYSAATSNKPINQSKTLLKCLFNSNMNSTMKHNTLAEIKLPKKSGDRCSIGHIYDSASGLVIANAASELKCPLVVITPDMLSANRLSEELSFYRQEDLPILVFPDWEILPYDSFSPHQDIISDRLLTLNKLLSMQKGVLIAPINTLMHRLLNKEFLLSRSFVLQVQDQVDTNAFSLQLQASGYRHVSQVMEHGEFSIRGSIIDLFPMGSQHPYRIDLFDDEVESIRRFDPDSQCSIEKIDSIELLPAKEYPMDQESIKAFRQRWRDQFEGNPANSPLYQSISDGSSAPGIEYYLPLFFEQTNTIFDYLPSNCHVVLSQNVHEMADQFWLEVKERYEQLRGDIEKPLLAPDQVVLQTNEIFEKIRAFPVIELSEDNRQQNISAQITHDINVHYKSEQPFSELITLVSSKKRVLFCAESTGRREVLLELLNKIDLKPKAIERWQEFYDDDNITLAIVVAPLHHGLNLSEPDILIITENQLFGQQVKQRRRQRSRVQDPEAIIRDLTELNIGAPVVHIDKGIGRYQGLTTITSGNITAEYLTLHYNDETKLYVPVSDIHLISRYTGNDNPPLHDLGSKRWQKIKQIAAKKARDVAAELLDIYAKREAKTSEAIPIPRLEYERFASSFPFEETPDQESAILAMMADLEKAKPMDRLICGDVGFGKTEVAMRAAFIVAMNGKQVGMLVPTTLLCEQHFKNFQDRFSDWPIKVAGISRFRSKKEQDDIVASVKSGHVDIVIGTHKLLQSDFNFHNLGLLIIDEEHRFGVRQKEKIKSLRSDVDIVTLTATPIPRTLNLSLTGLRDLSIIATPPARRLSVLTFVRQHNISLIREAILREILRGGQVFFLHNDVQTIEKTAREIEELMPEAKARIAHGQMPEKQLEQVMADFYHRRFNVLVCTTIIESGIDIPTANTIIINRADRFGLAQLHQMRGRVGRSHHQAYAYLLTPEESAMTRDAVKRLEAIATLGDLGSGFALATNDLEIRGAGEILGDGQSGHIQEVGFTLYSEMLDRAVKALKSGCSPEDISAEQIGPDVDLQVSALLPEDYIFDVQLRLSLYKRIANAENEECLNDLKAEIIDRFGLLPQASQNLFQQTNLKHTAKKLGIKKLIASHNCIKIELSDKPNINIENLIQLVQSKPALYRLEGSDKIRYSLVQNNESARFKAAEHLLAQLAEKGKAHETA